MTQNIEVLDKRVLVINDVEYDIIEQIFVPHIGWELDYLAFIIEYEGKRRLVYSDHGELYIKGQDMVPKMCQEHYSEDDKIPRDQNWILLKIEDLEDYLEKFKEALEILQGVEPQNED